ncbi:period homolog 1 [Zymobacter palmae]|uniref:Period homolog 1 n=1 Tax=Zymobacter palmae TaxID=33074 RepID=A0A348HIJ9_9GAMM|nr:period homolog 1 [Zymobacter palmae]
MEVRHFEDLRRVVDNDVDPGELLHGLNQDTQQYRTAEVAVTQEESTAFYFRSGLAFKCSTDAAHFACGRSIGTGQAFQCGFGSVHGTARSHPARTFRQEQHTDDHQGSRNHSNAQHGSPVARAAEG